MCRPTDLSTNLVPRKKRCKPRQPRQLMADYMMWLAKHWWKRLGDTITEVMVRIMPTD